MEAPSLWPARHERRHVAAKRDFEAISTRLHALEDSVLSLASRVEDIFNCVRKSNTSGDDEKTLSNDLPSVVDDLSIRLHRMELLLLRTSLDDFTKLDHEIASTLPKMKEISGMEQPDQEPTPSKPTAWECDDNSSSYCNADAGALVQTCLTFDMAVKDSGSELAADGDADIERSCGMLPGGAELPETESTSNDGASSSFAPMVKDRPEESDGECVKCGGNHKTESCPFFKLDKGVVPRSVKQNALKIAIQRSPTARKTRKS